MTQQTLLSWEKAVRWYRAQPGNEAEIRQNYFDLPVLQAAERFAISEEFAEVLRLIGEGSGRALLDFGAGNGIASFALAKHGWRVTALEPDESAEVGAGAIRALASQTGLPITVIQEFAETLPFSDGAFAAIHARQVMHHVPDLEAMALELARVLAGGGLLLVTREHVADDEKQLAAFRAEHPLHHLYGGENAYPLSRYLQAFERAGFRLRELWGPLESILNFYPGTEAERQRMLRHVVKRNLYGLGYLLSWSNRFRAMSIKRAMQRDRTPGRIYSFLLEKP
jgi:SAM-dependent methyltransferase